MVKIYKHRRKARQASVRKKVRGTKERPRLSVFRSNKHIWAQIINDQAGETLVSASDLSLKLKGKPKEVASKVGKDLAQRAKEVGVLKVGFDRGGYKYDGRVKALAEGAREGGLEF